MTRLTNNIKKTICENAINQSPTVQQIKNTEQKLKELAIEIYNDNVTSEQLEKAFKIQETINSLPFERRWWGDQNWFVRHCYLYVNFGGMEGKLDFPENEFRLCLEEIPTYSGDHEFSKRYLELQNKLDNLLKQKDDLHTEITAILNSCTTVKKLQQIWAESVNFIDNIETVPSNTLPAIVVADLNKKLGVGTE